MTKNQQKLNIICFSNQVWDSQFWTNKKHVMSRLGKLGHNVIFIDPMINLGFTFLKQWQEGLWKLSKIFGFTSIKQEYGVINFSPIVYIPLEAVVNLYMKVALSILFRRYCDPSIPTVVWVYHVQLKSLFKYLSYLKYDVLVYDCVDNYSAFPDNQGFFPVIVSQKELITQERDLSKKADVVFASAPGLVTKLQSFNKNIHFTPNVGDFKKYHHSRHLTNFPEDMQVLKNLNKPIVGFVGALDAYKFDLDLYKRAVRECPEFTFVLIGKLAVKDRSTTLESLGLAGLPNLHYLGPKPYETIENYIGGFDAYLIPYVLNEYTLEGCFPIKFHEALAAGLPTIVTDLPAYEPFSEVCYISKSASDYISNIKKAIAEDSETKILQRQAVAKENDWDGKVQTMLFEVNQLLEGSQR